MAGYSGTPLPKKLGIKPGHVVALHGVPAAVRAELADPHTTCVDGRAARADVFVFCTKERAELEAALARLGAAVFPDGALWIGWPKKAAKIPTDVEEGLLRELLLPTGLVDVKVCAIDATWSGLKFVWRKELRAAPPPPATSRRPSSTPPASSTRRPKSKPAPRSARRGGARAGRRAE